MKITIENVNPPSINHYWLGNGYHRYISKKGTEFKRLLALKAKEAGAKLSNEQIKMQIIWSYKGNRRRDIDNILKPILDSLEGVCYHNDTQITTLQVQKLLGTKDKLEIIITELI